MKKNNFLFSFLVMLAVFVNSCSKQGWIETEDVSPRLESQEFKNWAQARSGRWFTFLIGKAIRENPELAKEELLMVVDAYFEPLLNALNYYEKQFAQNRDEAEDGTVNELLEKQYRLHYHVLDAMITEVSMEELYQQYLALPKAPKRLRRSMPDQHRQLMGDLDPVLIFACVPPLNLTSFLDTYGGLPVYSDHYFYVHPTTTEEELEVIIGKLEWLMIVMPSMNSHAYFLSAFNFLTATTEEGYSDACSAVIAYASVLIFDYYSLSGIPDPGDPFPPGGGGGGPGGDPGDGGGNAPTTQELLDHIENKPFILLPPNIPCEIIVQWLVTATREVQQSEINKLTTIVNTTTTRPGITTTTVARLQDINDAHSTVVNMDYFPVTVTQLPIINGVRQTPEQFLEYIRKNINTFVDTDYAEFEPYQWYGMDETALWNSSNPLGAVIGIDMGEILGVFDDNGSVIVSDYSSSGWTFSTIYDPKYGQHPVSGHRDFGFTANANGSYTFYTRGVDRLTSWDITFMQSEFGVPFAQADALWTSFQSIINTFVNQNGGTSSVGVQQIHRPDWQQVKDVIEGRAPLSTLSKDCQD